MNHPCNHKIKLIDWSDTSNTEWTSTTYYPGVFRNLFTNPDYRHPDLFLNDDAQTRFTRQINSLADLIGFTFCKKRSLKKIYNLLEAAIPEKVDGTRETRFKRTASNILTHRNFEGCLDRAIAFVTLARKKGIPTIIVDTADLEWIKNSANLHGVGGHFYAEVKLGSKWYLVDPTVGLFYPNYNVHNYYFPGRRIAFYKSFSLLDVGIDSESSHSLLQRTAFWGTDILFYKDPGYRIIDLKDEDLINEYTERIEEMGLETDSDPINYDILDSPIREFTAPIEVEDLSNIR